MGFFIFMATVLVIGLMVVVSIAGTNTGYAQGYCAALHGVKISDDLCNVNGRVVEVKR